MHWHGEHVHSTFFTLEAVLPLRCPCAALDAGMTSIASRRTLASEGARRDDRSLYQLGARVTLC